MHRLIFILLVVLAACPLIAGDCRVVTRGIHREAVVLQEVSPYQYYSVGAAVQEEALAERIASLVLRKLAVKTEEPERLPLSAPGPLARCVKCHSDEKPKGGLSLTDLSKVPCEKLLDAIRRCVSDNPAERMPKGETLTAEELGEVIQILSGATK